ncbi:MAG: HEAT repeat domain-containing protein, partial [Verrucomicrobiota bacterium]
ALYQTTETNALISKYLMLPSYKERLSSGALAAFKAQEDPEMLEVLFKFLEKRSSALPSATLSSCLETVGALLRHNSQQKDRGRELLLSYIQHPREQVRLAAISGLGSSEDPRAIAVLETFANISESKPEKGAAEKAMEKIRSVKRSNEELKEVRNDIASLRDLNRELRKEVETLRKKVEAKP